MTQTTLQSLNGLSCGVPLALIIYRKMMVYFEKNTFIPSYFNHNQYVLPGGQCNRGKTISSDLNLYLNEPQGKVLSIPGK